MLKWQSVGMAALSPFQFVIATVGDVRSCDLALLNCADESDVSSHMPRVACDSVLRPQMMPKKRK